MYQPDLPSYRITCKKEPHAPLLFIATVHDEDGKKKEEFVSKNFEGVIALMARDFARSVTEGA